MEKYKITLQKDGNAHYCDVNLLDETLRILFQNVPEYMICVHRSTGIVNISGHPIAHFELSYSHYTQTLLLNNNNTKLQDLYRAGMIIEENGIVSKNRYGNRDVFVKLNPNRKQKISTVLNGKETFKYIYINEENIGKIPLGAIEAADIVFEEHGNVWYITKDKFDVFVDRKITF